ncbi:EAL domain-containing protein [Salmonella enterica]|nr:EAL domain-containing protein [Salmonella enterica]
MLDFEILKKIKRLRLSPVYSLHDEKNKINGYEVLSVISDTNSESFFNTISKEQMIAILYMQYITCYNKNLAGCFFNQPLKMILDEEYLAKILDLFYCGGHLEIQDSNEIIHLSDEEISILKWTINIIQLHGVYLWMDDVNERVLNFMFENEIFTHGVKIDKYVFWDYFSSDNDFNGLIMLSKMVSSKVIVEGIESVEHYDFVKSSGADFGQGYYWEDKLLFF